MGHAIQLNRLQEQIALALHRRKHHQAPGQHGRKRQDVAQRQMQAAHQKTGRCVKAHTGAVQAADPVFMGVGNGTGLARSARGQRDATNRLGVWLRGQHLVFKTRLTLANQLIDLQKAQVLDLVRVGRHDANHHELGLVLVDQATTRRRRRTTVQRQSHGPQTGHGQQADQMAGGVGQADAHHIPRANALFMQACGHGIDHGQKLLTRHQPAIGDEGDRLWLGVDERFKFLIKIHLFTP